MAFRTSHASCEDYQRVGDCCYALACESVRRNATLEERVYIVFSTTAGYTLSFTIAGSIIPGFGTAAGAITGVTLGFVIGSFRALSS